MSIILYTCVWLLWYLSPLLTVFLLSSLLFSLNHPFVSPYIHHQCHYHHNTFLTLIPLHFSSLIFPSSILIYDIPPHSTSRSTKSSSFYPFRFYPSISVYSMPNAALIFTPVHLSCHSHSAQPLL